MFVEFILMFIAALNIGTLPSLSLFLSFFLSVDGLECDNAALILPFSPSLCQMKEGSGHIRNLITGV